MHLLNEDMNSSIILVASWSYSNCLNCDKVDSYSAENENSRSLLYFQRGEGSMLLALLAIFGRLKENKAEAEFIQMLWKYSKRI